MKLNNIFILSNTLKTMKSVTFCLLFMFLLVFVSAEQQSLPTQKINTCVTLSQTCDSCSYVNLTTVKYPNSTEATIGKYMTQNGVKYTYSFCNTSAIGTYIVTTCGDVDGNETCVDYDFDVNVLGLETTGARSDASSRGAYFLFGLATLFFIAFIFTEGEKTIIKENGLVEVKNRTVIKWTFFLISVLFLMTATNIIFISIYNEVGDTQIGAIFDKMAAGSTYAFWGVFVIMVFIWVYASIATLADRKRMQQAEDTGMPLDFGGKSY